MHHPHAMQKKRKKRRQPWTSHPSTPSHPLATVSVPAPGLYWYGCPPCPGKLNPNVGTAGGVATATGSGLAYP